MTHSRRALIAAGATGVAALSAGCLDFVLGDGPLEFEAERAAPTDAALEETEFGEYEVKEETLEETIEAVVEREIEATYWISAYTREIEIGDDAQEGAGFVAVSTPDAEVAGRSFNPIADMDSNEILEEFAAELDEDQPVDDLSHERTTSISILGEDRDVDRYVGEREFEGHPVEIEILLASFGHEDDHLVVIGSYPRYDSMRDAAEAILEEEAEEHGIDEEHVEEAEAQGFDEDDVEEAEEQGFEEELPDDLPESVETLFEELEHPV